MENLIDQLKEKLKEVGEQIKDSGWYNELVEKYENLSPQTQKMAILGISFLGVLFILILPGGFLISSLKKGDKFSQDRLLIKELLEVGSSSQNNLLKSMTIAQVMSTARNQLAQNLAVHQIGSVGLLKLDEFAQKFKKSNLKHEGVSVELKKINLNQVINTAHLLESISPTIKLLSVNMTADEEDPHFYNVVYKLVSILIPEEPEIPETSPALERRRGRGGTPRGKRRGRRRERGAAEPEERRRNGPPPRSSPLGERSRSERSRL